MSEKSNAQPVSQYMKHKFEELAERASKDALSGLLNRETAEMYINQRLDNMLQNETCALFIVDIDNFKHVNDTLGHQAGDEAIRQSAHILSSLFRATDIVGRLGGDEFIILLTGTISEKQVRKKGKDICESLQLILGGSPAVTTTVSVGIDIASGIGLKFDDLYQAADLALYKAKRNGKNGFFVKHDKSLSGIKEKDNFLPVNTISLSGLLENMESAVSLLEIGEQIHIIYVSSSFCRILGVDSKTYSLPKTLSSIVHPDDIIGLRSALFKGLENDNAVDCITRVSPDNKKWYWWHIRASKIEYNNPHPVMLVTATDISEFKEKEHKLIEINKRLKSAFEQTAQGMWEVDLASKNITIFGYEGMGSVSESVQGEFPDYIIANGWIHPNSVPHFREFANELLSGKSQGYGNFIMQYHDTGCYGWKTMSYKMLYDDSGIAVKAIGIVEKLPHEFTGQDIKSPIKRFLPESLTSYLTVGLQANLTKDTTREFWAEGKDLSRQYSNEKCSSILKQEESKIFRKDDSKSLSAYFNAEHLIELYSQGKRWIKLNYRRIDVCGNIRWVNHVINLVKDIFTKDIYLFTYIIQSDLKHQREVELKKNIVYDQITGLYDNSTSRSLIEFQIEKGGFHECALAMIHLGGIEKLSARCDLSVNNKLYDITAAISTALGPECIIGQYNISTLIVFFPDIHSQDKIKRQIEDAFSFVRFSLSYIQEMDSMRFVAGVDCANINQADFISMTTNTINACQLWHNASADTVAFVQENNDILLNKNTKAEQLEVGLEGLIHPLCESQKDIILSCISAMLSSDSIEYSINSALGLVGKYYDADRVYIMSLGEENKVITMPFEWVSAKKASIQQAVSGLFIERFPILKRCMDEKRPIFISRILPFNDKVHEKDEKKWHFITFPLIEKDVVTSFLCIENPNKNTMDISTANALIPYILGEKKRFHTKAPVSMNAPKLFLSEMPNLRSYTNVIYSLNSDIYSSMGAICLDVPNISSINSNQGFEYGNKLLWYISKTLEDIFCNSFIFRTWDAEFVALCPNITRQVFIGRCTRMRSNLQRRYPKDVRIGYTWAEGVFSGKALVNEARSIMKCEHIKSVSEQDSLSLSKKSLVNIKDAMRIERFTVYFQPKVNIKDGSLLGIEALVRGIDEAGNIIPPDRFIRELETTGDIRDLDLYVLDRTLAQMDAWRKEELELVPVSVNFSRITLFDPTVLASVLAIQSRYPLLPPNLLEIEITENGMNVEYSSLSSVMEKFREFGISFALDDFGSAYSNISIFTNVKFENVKFDRSLISSLVDNPRGRMLVQDIVKICNKSNMSCVAEGVENKPQIEILKDAGCICAQGYYYDRPIPVELFEKKYLNSAKK